MSSADKKQLKHDVPGALAERLAAIRAGTTDWHEWHQAGVLVMQFVYSLLGKRNNAGREEAELILQYANRLFRKAFKYTTSDEPLSRHAINCDRALAMALQEVQYQGQVTLGTIDILRDTITALRDLSKTPENEHQLAIAEGFLARVYWLDTLSRGRGNDPLWPCSEQEGIANAVFTNNQVVSPDQGRAYCSHLLAMALVHHRRGNKKHSRNLARRTFKLASGQKDRPQQVRALAILFFGPRGDHFLRQRRDTPRVIRSVLAELEDLSNLSYLDPPSR